jgi:hypothetical protein
VAEQLVRSWCACMCVLHVAGVLGILYLHCVWQLAAEPFLGAVLRALRGAGLADGVEAVDVVRGGL